MALYPTRQYSSKNMEFSRVLEKGRPQQVSERIDLGGGGRAAVMTMTTAAAATKNLRAKINKIYFI
jgi:hypothetical protein